ncbi:MAG: glycoside hydrolase family 3 C-terminal domain-containing protein, partial [Chloroflexota bacterium]
ALPANAVAYSPTGDFEAHAEIGIVVVGEAPYAEGLGDKNDLTLADEDIAVINKTRAQCDKLVVVLLSGRPLLVTDVLEGADAFVAAWLPGTEGAGVVDVLTGDVPFTGKLNHTWPRNTEQLPLQALHDSDTDPLFPFGFGLT